MRLLSSATALTMCALPLLADSPAMTVPVDYGPRPLYLIDKLDDGALKDKLMSCMGQDPKRTLFSIGHRGAPMQFPEHTVESNVAAARMGAGILECDVTFTADLELVCRHSYQASHSPYPRQDPLS